LIHVFGEPSHTHCVQFFNGDDWLIIISRDLAPSEEEFKNRMLQLGFESDYNSPASLAQAEFCQLIFWPVDGKTIPAPKPFRVISRLPYTLSGQAESASIAQGLIVTANHVPFLGPYLRYVRELNGRVPKVNDPEWSLRGTITHACAPDTYAFCQQRYNLGPTHETDFINLLRKASELKCVLDWPGFANLVELDE